VVLHLSPLPVFPFVISVPFVVKINAPEASLSIGDLNFEIRERVAKLNDGRIESVTEVVTPFLHSRSPSMDLLYKEESYQIIGACFEVYKEKGCGFVEPVYQECLEIQFELMNLPYSAQTQLQLSYKGRPLKLKFIPDFVLFDKIIVELKAVKELNDEHRAQVHNYLRATGLRLGLLINFGFHPKIQHERIVF